MKKVPMRNPLLAADIAVQVQEWKILGRARQGGIDWNYANWVKDFPQYEDFLLSLKHKNLGLLDRYLVRSVVTQSISEGRLEEAFLAVMIWGYGFRGYGRYRSNKVMESAVFKTTLRTTITALHQGEVQAAYEALIENGPEGLGCAFGSKFLFFASPKNIENYPLIIDSLIATAINNAGHAHIGVQSLTAKKYFELVEKFHEAAKFYDVAPDELEELLFTNTYKQYNSGDWSMVEKKDLSRTQKIAWALLLATDMERKGHLLQVGRTFPCDGQYDCVSLKIFQNLDMEMNLNGSIFIHSKPEDRFDWESAIKLGILKTSRRLRGVEGKAERSGPSSDSNSYAWLSRALIGDGEIEVDNFLEVQNLSESAYSNLEQVFKDVTIRKSDWLLYKNNQISGLLVTNDSNVYDLSGQRFKITEDCNMPFEMYDGPDFDT